MSIAKRYLAYGLKKNLWRTVIFSAISVLICLMVVSSESAIGRIENKSTGIYMLAIVIGAFSTMMPMLELEDFKNRRNLDTLYFFPIDRKKMAAVHFISGFIQVVAIYTVAFVTSFVYLLATTNCFELGYMIPYYFASLALGFIVYSIFSFMFNQGNTVGDGVMICLLWAFVAYVVMWAMRNTFVMAFWGPDIWYVEDIHAWNSTADFSSWGIVYAPINNLTVIFQDLIEVNRQEQYYAYGNTNAYEYIQQMYMFFVWGAVGFVAAIGFVFSFARKGAHLAGEPSSSWFGYKTLIPVYGYSIILYYASHSEDVFMLVMSLIMMLVGYIIYRRSFKIKRSDVIMLVCSIIPIVVGLILSTMMPIYHY